MQLNKGMSCKGKFMIKKTNNNPRHGENREAQIFLKSFS
jgi:hypothetical protein